MDTIVYVHRGPSCRRGYGAIPVDILGESDLRPAPGLPVAEEWKDRLKEILRARVEEMESPTQRQMADQAVRLRKLWKRAQDLFVFGHISEADYHAKHQALIQEISVCEAQQARPPYDLDELLQRLETDGRERIALANPDTQKQLISAIFTRVEHQKNADAGDWIISSATIRKVFTNLFQDLRDNVATYAPKGIRIPVAALKGLCPSPLDDGGVFEVSQRLILAKNC